MPYNKNHKTGRQLHEQSKRTQRISKYTKAVDKLKAQIKKANSNVKYAIVNKYNDRQITELTSIVRNLNGKLDFYLNKIERNQ